MTRIFGKGKQVEALNPKHEARNNSQIQSTKYKKAIFLALDIGIWKLFRISYFVLRA